MRKILAFLPFACFIYSFTVEVFAGVLIVMLDPNYDSCAPIEIDIVLENPDKIDLLDSNFLTMNNHFAKTYICKEPGWFAAAYGDNNAEYVCDRKTAVAGTCGYDTRREAEETAVKNCQNEAPYGVICELLYVKFDDGTQSFLSQFSLSNTGEAFLGSDGSTYLYGHGRGSGLD